MKRAIDISNDQAARPSSEAEKLSVSPVGLVEAAVADMLARKDDFANAAACVLGKNRELYGRLS